MVGENLLDLVLISRHNGMPALPRQSPRPARQRRGVLCVRAVPRRARLPRSAAKLSPKHALGAEVAGRVGLNLAVDLLSGSPLTAAVDLSVTAGYAAFKAMRAPKAKPQNLL